MHGNDTWDSRTHICEKTGKPPTSAPPKVSLDSSDSYLSNRIKLAQDRLKERTSALLIEAFKISEDGRLGVSRKIELYKSHCGVYRDFGQWEDVLATAITAISLAEKIKTNAKPDAKGVFCCLAAEASEHLQNRMEAVKYLHQATEVLVGLTAATPARQRLQVQLNKLRLEISRCSDGDSKTSMRTSVGISEGEIHLSDVSISFVRNAFKIKTLIRVVTVLIKNDGMENLVAVSPVLVLAPNANLNGSAIVVLQTWVIPEKDELVDLYFRESEISPWIFQKKVSVGPDGKAKFRIKKFCEYVIFTHCKALLNMTFKLQSCLFVNKETKKLSNRLTADCETCMASLTQRMEKLMLKPICIENPRIYARVNDEVQVQVSNIRDASGEAQPRQEPKRAKVTVSFLKEKTHGVQDFPLSRDCRGLVEFHHTVQVYRQDQPIDDAITHDCDRINLDYRDQPGTSISGAVVATDHAHVHM